MPYSYAGNLFIYYLPSISFNLYSFISYRKQLNESSVTLFDKSWGHLFNNNYEVKSEVLLKELTSVTEVKIFTQLLLCYYIIF